MKFRLMDTPLETPPLTRRKLLKRIPCTRRSRNTSAHAEKTAHRRTRRNAWRKHLRSRGENIAAIGTTATSAETPPLTRRKRADIHAKRERGRNTSAHAEKTSPPKRLFPVRGKHLRSRGENVQQSTHFRQAKETPPLTRRKPLAAAKTAGAGRNTSAHAEKTLQGEIWRQSRWKHLRSRGENGLGLLWRGRE